MENPYQLAFVDNLKGEVKAGEKAELARLFSVAHVFSVVGDRIYT